MYDNSNEFRFLSSLLADYAGYYTNKHYKYIPSKPEYVRRGFEAIHNYLKKGTQTHFFEIGAAYGLNLSIAQDIGWQVSGIEINRKIINFLRRVNKGYSYYGDIILHKEYGNYDVIYAYLPHIDMVLNMEMWDVVVEQAKPGAIIWQYSGEGLLNKSKQKVRRVFTKKIDECCGLVFEKL